MIDVAKSKKDTDISVKEDAFQRVKLSLCGWFSTVLMLACLLLKVYCTCYFAISICFEALIIHFIMIVI